MLAEHPEIYARLRREVLGTLGPNGKVDPDNLRDMKYLRAVLNGSICVPRLAVTRLTLYQKPYACTRMCEFLELAVRRWVCTERDTVP